MSGIYLRYSTLVAVILSGLFQNVYGNFMKPQYYQFETNETVLFQKWNVAETKFREFVESAIKQVMPMLITANSELDLSTECTSAFLTMLRGVRNFEVWAFSNATGKIGDGLMTGSTTSFGAYDQCLETTVPDGKGGIKFRGQYCSIEARFPLPEKPKYFFKMGEKIPPLDRYNATTPLFNSFPPYSAFFYNFAYRIAVCVPSLCNINDIQQIASSVTKIIEYNSHVRGCEILETGLKMDLTQTIIFSIALIFGVFVFMATIIDYLPEIMNKPTKKSDNKSLCTELIEAFSARANTRRLLQTNDLGDTSILNLHGIRVFTITWIILVHSYLYIDMQLPQHFRKSLEVLTSISYQTLANATPCVDTFFFVGGFLLCYLTIINVEKMGPQIFNVPILVGRRIWRLLPTAMMAVGLAILMPVIGSGPLWKENIEREANVCRRKWWGIFLFGNNFIDVHDMCLPHTWFISTYMHLFIYSMVYLYLALRKLKLAISIHVIFIMVGILAPGIITYVFNLPPVTLTIHPDAVQRLEFGRLIHLGTYAHTSPYGIGMTLGHLLAKYRNQIKFSRKKLLIGWMLAFICNLTIIYSVHIWLHRDYTILESLAYASLYRVGWSLGLAWVVTVCTVGQGGLVNDILSWKAFVPLSRLTFMAYLVHPLVIDGYYSSLRTGFEASNIVIVWHFITFAVVSFGIGGICRIIFEAPLLETEKVILGRLLFRKKDKNENNVPVRDVKVNINKNGFDKSKIQPNEENSSKL